MLSADFSYSCRKIKMTARDCTGSRQAVCGLYSIHWKRQGIIQLGQLSAMYIYTRSLNVKIRMSGPMILTKTVDYKLTLSSLKALFSLRLQAKMCHKTAAACEERRETHQQMR